jgi:hypothetical protein
MTRRVRREDYTIRWVCALPVELAAAQEMLDEEQEDLKKVEKDDNLMLWGKLEGTMSC